jgi:hypothetical protein
MEREPWCIYWINYIWLKNKVHAEEVSGISWIESVGIRRIQSMRHKLHS